MKKIVVLALLVMFVSLLAAVVASADDGGAVVIHEGRCGLLTPSNTVFFDYDGVVNDVTTPNGDGKATCRSQLPASVAPPATAVRLNYENTGRKCGTLGTDTLSEDWQEVITPSGEVILTCLVKSAE